MGNHLEQSIILLQVKMSHLQFGHGWRLSQKEEEEVNTGVPSP
jgi:hypothetical protein